MSHWYDSTPKKSRRKRDSNPRSSALEAGALSLGQGGGLGTVGFDLRVCCAGGLCLTTRPPQPGVDRRRNHRGVGWVCTVRGMLRATGKQQWQKIPHQVFEKISHITMNQKDLVFERIAFALLAGHPILTVHPLTINTLPPPPTTYSPTPTPHTPPSRPSPLLHQTHTLSSSWIRRNQDNLGFPC